MRKVDTNGPNGCWVWLASTKFDGYGQFGINGTIERSHRIMWEHVNGPIPEDKCVLHSCDNRRCVNPEHLFLGTRADNADDKVSKGRQTKGASAGTAKLDEGDVNLIRDLYSSESLNQADIADVFGISQSQVSRIIRNENWKG
ncbi:MAG: HNH endonuclease [Candidatus Izemoplasmatales bacterium]|jgi:hypothetical protein